MKYAWRPVSMIVLALSVALMEKLGFLWHSSQFQMWTWLAKEELTRMKLPLQV